MKKLKRITASILILLLVLTTPAFAGENLQYIEKSAEAKFFDQVSSDLVELYQFDISKQELLERTLANLINDDPKALDSFLRALFSSLDEYSEFYSPEEYAELERSLENVGGGIGIQMNKESKYIEVIKVLDNMPAQKAGIMAGDMIVKVDGEDVSGKSIEYASTRLRGDVGTEVKVTVLRGGQMLDFTIVRGELKQSSVLYTVVDKNVAYIQIESFTSDTDNEMGKVLTEIDRLGIKKIILDLRYNSGGYLDVAINVAKRFVPAGIIITHKTKYGDTSKQYRSTLPKKKYQLVTLVNEYTASAAEILASALQESGASKLVGTQTYGKAVTQSVFGLYGGRMCKVTTGEYITRKGNKINKVGIKPDYDINNFKLKFEYVDADEMKFAPEYAIGYDGDAVRAIKQRLNVLGYDAGYFDEPYDEQTKYAVEAFQNDKGLAATGVLDINTQIYLSGEADKVEVMVDNQMAKAFELFGIEYPGYLPAK